MSEVSEYGKLQRVIRQQAKMSIRALSEKSGVSHSYLSQVENGTRDTPSPEIIKKIADALNYDYFALMRVAGYMGTSANTIEGESDFVPTLIKGISLKEKKEFTNRFFDRVLKLFDYVYEKINKTDEEHDAELEELNIEINEIWEIRENFHPLLEIENQDEEKYNELLTDFFQDYASASDYLKLLRMYRGISVEDISSVLAIDSEIYKKNEDNLILDSLFINSWNEKLSKILGVDDLETWIKKQPTFILFDALKEVNRINKGELINIEFSVPRYLATDKYSIELSVEEAKEQFLYLENLLSMDENVYFNKKVLTKNQKKQLLKIVDAIFADDLDEME